MAKPIHQLRKTSHPPIRWVRGLKSGTNPDLATLIEVAEDSIADLVRVALFVDLEPDERLWRDVALIRGFIPLFTRVDHHEAIFDFDLVEGFLVVSVPDAIVENHLLANQI